MYSIVHVHKRENEPANILYTYILQTVDEHDNVLGPYKHGEIRVKGPQIMKAYLNNPKSTADTLRKGWIYTGARYMGYSQIKSYVPITYMCYNVYNNVYM